MATQKQTIDNQLASNNVRANAGRDKYGRSTVEFVKVLRAEDGTYIKSFVAMMVKLPKSATEVNPERQYLVNDWSTKSYEQGATDAERGVSYHQKRHDAQLTAIAAVVAAAERHMAAVSA